MARVPLNEQMIELVARRFRMLGEPQRLRILESLQAGEKTVNDIVEGLGGNQPNISRHLQVLFDGGLVARRRSGNNIYYSIADPVIPKLCDLVCQSAVQDARAKLVSIAGEEPAAARRK